MTRIGSARNQLIQRITCFPDRVVPTSMVKSAMEVGACKPVVAQFGQSHHVHAHTLHTHYFDVRHALP